MLENKNVSRLLSSFCLLVFALRAAAQPGLLGEYFRGENFEEKVFERTDPAINFAWDRSAPGPNMPESFFSVRWTGVLKAPMSGDYTFSAKVDDGIRVWLDGRLIIDAWKLNDYGQFKSAVRLEANRFYDLKVEYFNNIFEGEVALMWRLPAQSGGLFGARPQRISPKFFFQKRPDPPPAAPPQVVAKPKPKPRPAKPVPSRPAPKPDPVPGEGQDPEIRNIYFLKSKDEMTPGSIERLEAVVAYLKKHAGTRVELRGHTDPLGNAAKNQQLSEERARVVADFLAKQGIAPERIRAQGFGGTRPFIPNPKNDVERDQNRRVEFWIN